MTSSNASCPKPTMAHPAWRATTSGTFRSGGCASGGASGTGGLTFAAGAGSPALDGAGGVEPLLADCALMVDVAPVGCEIHGVYLPGCQVPQASWGHSRKALAPFGGASCEAGPAAWGRYTK